MAGPGVIAMLVGGVGLLFVRSAQVPLWAVFLGLVLFVLLRTNRIRTAAWSAYGLLDLWMVWQSAP